MSTPASPKATPSGPPSSTGTLGTFAGVFTPSILTILGIILFLRLGYVVGAGGIGKALLIILFANAISVLTSVSLSAIATNLHVKGGGDYYLISRTLGVEFGGALGLVLFLAQSISVAFYVIGFGEAVAAMVPGMPGWGAQAVAAVAVAALFALAFLGADWATRFQYGVMAILFAALLVFFIRGAMLWDNAVLRDNLAPATDLPFWVLFAIFFPAVTGFTQGVSMSGDLRSPGRSLPLGTFLAVGLSAAVYIGGALVFAAALPAAELSSDYGAMSRVSGIPWLINAGVIGATLSSALASFLGAPRILQSLAGDRVFPALAFFAKGHGATNNPRRGVLLSAVIAFATVALGNLNVIAPVVSMFFLISYGLLNYATYFVAKANSPSFRPRFRLFHARLSLVGCLGCLGAMLAIHPTAGAVALAILFAVHQYLSRTVAMDRWADSSRSHRLQRIRQDLLAVSSEMEHALYWRPVTLAFSNDEHRREPLLRFAGWLDGGAGFTTAVRLMSGEGLEGVRACDAAEEELRQELRRYKVGAFARAIMSRELEAALPVLLQSHGLGTLRPNTVMLNWFDQNPGPDDPPGLDSYGRYLRTALRHRCNLVLLAATSSQLANLADIPAPQRCIDLWYRDSPTGRLMLLLAHLMTRTDEWDGARLRLLSVAEEGTGPEEALQSLRRMLDEVRIEAEPVIVSGRSPEEVVRQSAVSTLVFLPFRFTEDVPAWVDGSSVDGLVRELGITALVLAARTFELDAEPESGAYQEAAAAVDAAADLGKASRKLEAAATKSAAVAEDLREQAASDRENDVDLSRAAETAAEEAEKLRRRAMKAKGKAEIAEKEAKKIVGEPDTPENEETSS